MNLTFESELSCNRDSNVKFAPLGAHDHHEVRALYPRLGDPPRRAEARYYASLEELCIAVPGDIAVAGFDDIEFAEMTSPALTTIRQPRREPGRSGASVLLKLMRGQTPPRRIRLDTELIERDSTAGPRRR